MFGKDVFYSEFSAPFYKNTGIEKFWVLNYNFDCNGGNIVLGPALTFTHDF